MESSKHPANVTTAMTMDSDANIIAKERIKTGDVQVALQFLQPLAISTIVETASVEEPRLQSPVLETVLLSLESINKN